MSRNNILYNICKGEFVLKGVSPLPLLFFGVRDYFITNEPIFEWFIFTKPLNFTSTSISWCERYPVFSGWGTISRKDSLKCEYIRSFSLVCHNESVTTCSPKKIFEKWNLIKYSTTNTQVTTF